MEVFGTHTIVKVGVVVNDPRIIDPQPLTAEQQALMRLPESSWCDAEGEYILGINAYDENEEWVHMDEAAAPDLVSLIPVITSLKRLLKESFGLDAHAYIIRFEYTLGVEPRNWTDQLIGIPDCALAI